MSTLSMEEKMLDIDEQQPCIIVLYDMQGTAHRYDCHYRHKNGKHFSIIFNTPESVISHDIQKKCSFSTAPLLGQDTFSCNAEIVEEGERQELQLIALKDIDPASLRQFFRVTLRSCITVSHNEEDDDWRVQGETIDLSRTGVLAIIPQECPHEENLQICLDLPDPVGTACCGANVIRSKRLTKSRWLTAFHFNHVSLASADIITANCLQEQRRQIRENVETR